MFVTVDFKELTYIIIQKCEYASIIVTINL